MRREQTESLTLTVEEAAARLGISRTLAYELAKVDRLPAPVLRLGRRLVVSRQALERVLTGEPRERHAANDGSGDEAA
jgi:excisionase family DNA binding protein